MKPTPAQKPDMALFELHAEVCKIFSHPKRLQIIEALRENELTVSELVERLRLPKANVSQHLAVLRQKKVVTTRREGLNIYYRIANPKIIRACDLMRLVLVEQLEEGQRLAKKLRAR
jgi:DNA-binding transcriptional ArsR family regulator